MQYFFIFYTIIIPRSILCIVLFIFSHVYIAWIIYWTKNKKIQSKFTTGYYYSWLFLVMMKYTRPCTRTKNTQGEIPFASFFLCLIASLYGQFINCNFYIIYNSNIVCVMFGSSVKNDRSLCYGKKLNKKIRISVENFEKSIFFFLHAFYLYCTIWRWRGNAE